jgi:DNA-binding transcriptional LysR family regulator
MTKSRSATFDRRTLDGLSVLKVVIQAGSFLRAAETLGLTQSAVSRAVARLEDRVAVRLFRRTARSISLTDEGLRFYESVAPHLAAIEDATIEAAGSSTKVRGRLRVNVDAGVAQFVLVPPLQPFLAKHPDLAVEIDVRDRMGDLVREGFDVAVRFGIPEPSALQTRLLMRTRIVTVASPAYLKRRGMPRHPRDIAQHECVLMRDPSTGKAFGWEFVRGKTTIPVNVSGQLMVNAVGPMLAACVAGLGIAQVLELYSRKSLAGGQLIQLLPEWTDETYPLHAYHHSAQLMSAKVRAFLDFIVGTTRT